MKTLTTLVFFSLILGVFPATFLQLLPILKGHENECYDEESKKFYKIGEEIEWSECGQKLCTKDGRELMFEHYTCGVMSYPENCKKEVDLTLPYPECCGQIICPDEYLPKKKAKKNPSKKATGYSPFFKKN